MAHQSDNIPTTYHATLFDNGIPLAHASGHTAQQALERLEIGLLTGRYINVYDHAGRFIAQFIQTIRGVEKSETL